MADDEHGSPSQASTVMTDSTTGTKTSLRKAMHQVLAAMGPAARAQASSAICDAIQRSTAWSHSRSVLLFSPLPDEPDIWPLATETLAAGKLLALPRFNAGLGAYEAAMVSNLDSDLIQGRYGIREPAPGLAAVHLNQLDLILVPGVAFDVCGHRLGRGRGYYDRMLKLVRSARLGVAFDSQVVADLPVDPHDERLNAIVTPTRWLTVRG